MSSTRFIESLKIQGERFSNIELHQQRVDLTCKAFSINRKIELKDIIIPESNDALVQKCRIIYSKDDFSVSFTPYKQRMIESLKVVFDDSINYGFKFEDRDRLNGLFDKRGDCGDILIVKNGCLTDTSFSNIVLFDGDKYFTPSSFLLNGTMRQKLLRDKLVFEKEIKLDDIKRFKKLYLINALNSLEDNLSISVENIY
ncbi:MAG: 4-amino-4-deoxychorismate lyase [Bacteroidetes bacterium]|nr:4-amino-4-deoxychorismate lyase [Bacteroidota bacterium]